MANGQRYQKQYECKRSSRHCTKSAQRRRYFKRDGSEPGYVTAEEFDAWVGPSNMVGKIR